MTLLEAIRAAVPADPLTSHGGIRRASWVEGHRIQWAPAQMCWLFGNRFEVAPLTAIGRRWSAGEASQGILTPESMLAEDWELVI